MIRESVRRENGDQPLFSFGFSVDQTVDVRCWGLDLLPETKPIWWNRDKKWFVCLSFLLRAPRYVVWSAEENREVKAAAAERPMQNLELLLIKGVLIWFCSSSYYLQNLSIWYKLSFLQYVTRIDFFFLEDKELKWNRIDLSKCEQFFIFSKKLLLINILLFQFAHKLYWNILFQHKHSPNYDLLNLNNCIKIYPKLIFSF